jgi:hypothetical protein
VTVGAVPLAGLSVRLDVAFLALPPALLACRRMQDEISVDQHSSPPSQPSQPFESGSPQSPGSLTTSSAVDREGGRDGSAEGSVKDEEAPSKPKKPRLPRCVEVVSHLIVL